MFDLKLPHIGHFNFRANSVHISRVNKRQNKKGIYEGNILCRSFVSYFRTQELLPSEFVRTQEFQLTTQCLNQTLYSKFTPFKRAFTELKAKQVLSRAISPDILLSVGLKDLYPSLWLGKSYVGKALTPQEVVVELPLLYEEVREKLKPLHINVRNT